MYHEKTTGFTEISGRMIVDWAKHSGIWSRVHRTNHDKPEIASNIPNLDDGSVSRFLRTIAPLQSRNYVIQEVRGNLLEDERKALLATFPSTRFKKIASIQIGEPTLEFKRKTQEMTLAQKQEASDVEFRLKKESDRRKKAMERQQRQDARERRKREREWKEQQAEEAKKKREEEKKLAEARKAEEEKKKTEDAAKE